MANGIQFNNKEKFKKWQKSQQEKEMINGNTELN